MDIKAFLARNPRTILQFSAGKDSLACLWLLKPYLDQIKVIWVNPGHPYPETLAYMAKVAREVPHFLVLKGNQPEWIAKNGYPTDAYTLGMTDFAYPEKKLSFVTNCCQANLWFPMQEFIRDSSITGVIRGQKSSDHLRAPVKSLDTVNGIEYLFPLEKWSDQDVIEFLGNDIPDSYKRGLKSSLDCATCTGYQRDNPGRFADLEKVYPEAAAEIKPILFYIKCSLTETLNGYS